jgi:hypothetical protein
MRRLYLLALMSATVIAGVVALAVSSSASAAPNTTTLKLFFKVVGSAYKTASGGAIGNNTPPAVGDYFEEFIDVYTGTAADHSTAITGSAVLECTVYKVVNPNKNLPGICQGTIAIGNSMLVSTSKSNLAGNQNVYPITGGTGSYLHAKGTVTTKKVGNNSNAVVKFTT